MVWKRAEDLVDYYADDFKDFTRISAQAMFKNDSETVYENVAFTSEKGVEYKSLTNFTRQFTKIVSPWPDDDPEKPEQVLRATSQTPSGD